MAVKVGILGVGFMGNCHLDAYGSCEGAQVVALCDIDAARLRADARAAGNIGFGAGSKDLSGVQTYTDAEMLLANPDVEVVDVALPTYLHAEYAIRAMRAGKHVICEKPMAISSADAEKMLAASKETGRRLLVAQCIRFWPSYAAAREMIRSKEYGEVQSAVFTRLSAAPTWSWNNWIHDPRKSGSAALDLHIHDADFILYAFGRPKAVFSRGSGTASEGFGHIVTAYDYGAGRLILAEGAWLYPGGFPFSMTFRVAMEKATLELAADGQLKLHHCDGRSETVAVPEGTGYQHELRHFVDCIGGGRDSAVVPPESALESVRLVEAEIQSASTGKAVLL